jgi:hypothetical protein
MASSIIVTILAHPIRIPSLTVDSARVLGEFSPDLISHQHSIRGRKRVLR